MGYNPAAERSQPVSLSSPRQLVGPPSGSHTARNRCADAHYGSLYPSKVSSGPYPHNTSAIRTTPTLDQDLLDKPVEQRPYISMTPDPITMTSRTRIRSRPRKVTAPLHNLLDGNAKGKYHRNTFWRASGPVHYKGGSSVKPPPSSLCQNIPTILPVRSTYSENISRFRLVQSGILHHTKKSAKTYR